jgi:hypothetical protein
MCHTTEKEANLMVALPATTTTTATATPPTTIANNAKSSPLKLWAKKLEANGDGKHVNNASEQWKEYCRTDARVAAMAFSSFGGTELNGWKAFYPNTSQ